MDTKRKAVWLFVVGGLLVALGLAFFVSPYASTSPDGLNKVAADEGFGGAALEHALDDSPVAGYAVEGVDDPKLSKGLSGAIGVVMTFGIGMILFGLLVRRNHRAVSPTDPSEGDASAAAGAS
jgi:hypothetical protein